MLFELDYAAIAAKILTQGEVRNGRNGRTLMLPAQTLVVNAGGNTLPLLHGRKMFYKGVLGELAAFFRGPKCVQDFKDFGCNYWDGWGEEDGSIRVDYGNKWRNFGGVDQLERLLTTLRSNPHDRRMVISGWDPSSVDHLSLPCCHLLYQWMVCNGELHMIWYQRSADWMIGVPSDIILAYAMNKAIANAVHLKMGSITMIFGDAHIYEEHIDQAREYISRVDEDIAGRVCTYDYSAAPGLHPAQMLPQHFEVTHYEPEPAIKMELKL